MKHFIFFVIGMGLAGVVGVAVTQAGTSTNYVALDTSAIIEVEDSVTIDPNAKPEVARSVEAAQANNDIHKIPEWGVMLSGVSVESHEIQADAVLLKTKGYNQLQAVFRLQDVDFEQCVGHWVRLHKIAKANTTRDINAQPWWTVQQELEAAGRLVGDTYYYFMDSEFAECSGGLEVLGASHTTLSIDRSQILKGLTR